MEYLYNENAKVEITKLVEAEAYDFLNLNVFERTKYLNQHFQILKDALKAKLNKEEFDDFGLPLQDEV